MAFVLILRTMA